MTVRDSGARSRPKLQSFGPARIGTRTLSATALAVALLAGCGNSLSHEELVHAAVGPSGPTASAPVLAGSGGTQASGAASGALSGSPAVAGAGQSAALDGTVPSGGAGQLPRDGAVGSADSPPGGKAQSRETGGSIAKPVACVGQKPPIVLGSVGQLTGVVGAAFIGGTRAIQAWVASTNATGGLNCHPVRYLALDDGADPSRHLALVRKLVEQDKVIAMLYQTALFTGQASKDYLLSKKIPLVGQEAGEIHTYDSPLFFNHGSSGPALFKFSAVAAARAAKAQGLSKAGVLVCQEVVGCQGVDQEWADNARQLGLDLVYRAKASLFNVDFTSQCLAAKNAGVEVLGVSFDSTGIHRVAQACASVGYRPMIVCFSLQSSLDFRSDENLEGAVIAQPFRPWFLVDTPAMKEYQGVLQQYAPNVPLDASSINGWTAAQLLTRATAAFRADAVTSEGIAKALWAVKNDDLGGLTYPLSFSATSPQEKKACGWIVRVQKGQFTSDGKRFCG